MFGSADLHPGDASCVQQDLPGARAALSSGLAIAERLVAVDPDNAMWLLDLSYFHERLGEVLRVQGDPAGALDSHRASLRLIERLMELDPGNPAWLRAQSGGEGQIGLALLAQEDHAGAIEHFQAAVQIAKRLVARDSTNAVWQEGVAIAAARLGNALHSQGDLGGAIDLYDEVIDHFARAMEMAGNGNVQRQLRFSLNKRGDMLLEAGDGDGAIVEHEAALVIARKLAETSPSDPRSQRDLISSYVKMQEVTGDGDYARRALEVALRMQAEGILATEDEWMIEDLRQRAGG